MRLRETDGMMIGSEGVRAESLLLPGAGFGLAAFMRTLASARAVTRLATDDAEAPRIDTSSGLDVRRGLDPMPRR